MSGEINDLKQGLEFTNKEVDTVKDTLSNKVDSARVERFLLWSYPKQHLEPPHLVGRRSGNNARSSNKYIKKA